MYTILVNSDDSMVATNREPIYHKSSMMRKLRFLVDPTWTADGEESDLREYVCTMEYRTPISKKYIPVILKPSEELYKDMLEYVVDIDTAITAEVGYVELKLTWMKLEMDDDGTFKEHCRPIPQITIEILPVAQWSDYIPSADLDNIAQMVLTNQAYMEQMKVYAEQLQTMGQALTLSKADNVTYNKETNKLQLQSMGRPIGNEVELSECTCDGTGGGSGSGYDEDGLPTVDFDPIIETTDDDDGAFDAVLF